MLCAKLRLDGDFDFIALAKATPGYVGADLAALTGAAGIIAVKRIFKQLSDGTLVLPDPELQVVPNPDGEQDITMAAVGPPPTVLDTPVPNPTLFSGLSSQVSSGSIAHFLIAHPDPLTEAQLAPICITFPDSPSH